MDRGSHAFYGDLRSVFRRGRETRAERVAGSGDPRRMMWSSYHMPFAGVMNVACRNPRRWARSAAPIPCAFSSFVMGVSTRSATTSIPRSRADTAAGPMEKLPAWTPCKKLPFIELLEALSYNARRPAGSDLPIAEFARIQPQCEAPNSCESGYFDCLIVIPTAVFRGGLRYEVRQSNYEIV